MGKAIKVAPVNEGNAKMLNIEVRKKLAVARGDIALVKQLQKDLSAGLCRRNCVRSRLTHRTASSARTTTNVHNPKKKMRAPLLLENRPSKPTPAGHVHKAHVVSDPPDEV